MADTWVADVYNKIEKRMQTAAEDFPRGQLWLIFPVRDRNATNRSIEITAAEWVARSKDERIALIRERGE